MPAPPPPRPRPRPSPDTAPDTAPTPSPTTSSTPRPSRLPRPPLTASEARRARDAPPDRPPAGLSRREALGLAWLGAIGVLLGQSLEAVARFAMPYRPGVPPDVLRPYALGVFESGGRLDDAETVLSFWDAGGSFYWVQSEEGARAIYGVCTYLGCRFRWKEDQGRFICPCHGQQYSREGAWLRGPAERSADQLVIHVYDEDGDEIARTPKEGGPLRIPAGGRVVVDEGDRILGAPKRISGVAPR